QNIYDAVIIKFDNNGDTLFVRQYDGGSEDEGNYLVETKDKGFAIVGKSKQSGSGDFCLIKLDSLGNFQWKKGYLNNYADTRGWSVAHAHDGGYIMSGVGYLNGYDYNTYILKTDSVGNEEWRKTYGS